MARYHWSFNKTLEYLDSKRSNLEIKGNYFGPLQAITTDFERYNEISGSWHNDYKSSLKFREEEIIMTNTFLNTQKIKLNWLVLDYFLKKKRHKTCEKKTKKVIRWADRIKKERKKARSVQKTKGVCLVNKKKPAKVKKQKAKFRNKNIKTELNESYEEMKGKKAAYRQKYNSLEVTELYNKRLKQFESKKGIINKNLGKAVTNNSLSKSTNVQEDYSNIEKNESNEGKKDNNTILKEGRPNSKNIKSFRSSFLNDIKIPKSRKTNERFFSEIEKTDKSKLKTNREKKNLDKKIIRDKFEKLMKKKLDGKRLKLSNIEIKKKVRERNSSVIQKKEKNNTREERRSKDKKNFDQTKLNTQLQMRKWFEQNKKYNKSIEPVSKKEENKILKSNKNSELFFKNRKETQQRPSSAPNKGWLIR